jgi:hypothetical protein
MAVGPHFFGACLVSVGTGEDNAMEALGYTTDGVDITYSHITEPYQSDVSGKATRGVKTYGPEAHIKCRFIEFDTAIWAKVMALYFGGTQGVAIAAGTIINVQGYAFPVQISSTSAGLDAETCWEFNVCYPVGDLGENYGTTEKMPSVTFHAILPHTDIGTTAGAVLYQSC